MPYQTRILPGSFQPNWTGTCFLWYRIDLGRTTVSGAVSQLNDQSSTGANTSQTTAGQRPTLNTSDSSYGGMPTMSLASASTQFLSSANGSVTNQSQPITLILVGEGSQSTGLQWMFSIGNNSLSPLCAICDEGTAAAGKMSGYAGGFGIVTVSDSAGIFVCVINGASSSFYRNATVSLATINSSTGQAGNAAFLGARSDGVQTLQGKLAECIAFTGDLTAAASGKNLTTVLNYLKSRYSINWKPTDFPGCALWLDATQGVTNTGDGTTPTAWADQSGNGLNVTNTGSPVYHTGGGGGKNLPRITLAASSTNGFTNTTTNVVASGVTRTAFFAGKPRSGGGGGDIITFKQSNTRCSFQYFNVSSANFIYTDAVSINNEIPGTSLPSTGSVLVLDWVYTSGAPCVFNINGVSQTIAGGNTSTDSGTSPGFQIGTNQANQSFDGDLYEIIVYSGTLTTAQSELVRQYLANKWGGTTA